MAYAQLAGVPAIHGLYSAIFALLTYPWFSTAPQLSVGPVAVVRPHCTHARTRPQPEGAAHTVMCVDYRVVQVSLLSNAAVSLIATEGTARFTQLSMMLALLCGVLQV